MFKRRRQLPMLMKVSTVRWKNIVQIQLLGYGEKNSWVDEKVC